MDATGQFECKREYNPHDPFPIEQAPVQFSGQISSSIKKWGVGIIADEFFTRIDPVELTCLFVSSKLLFNLSSLPAISIPCRKTKTSLSIGYANRGRNVERKRNFNNCIRIRTGIRLLIYATLVTMNSISINLLRIHNFLFIYT